MRAVALTAAALVLLALVGCGSGSSSASKTTSQTPVGAPKVVSGALPGLQVVAVSKLKKLDQRAIEMWQLTGESADSNPTLKAGTYTPGVDGHVLQANTGTDSQNGIAVTVVEVHFDPVGTQQLTALTTANAGKQLAIVLNGKVISAPTVQEPITTGVLQISGQPGAIDTVVKAIMPSN